ncbi:MAG: hypothetical protein Q9M91_02140 [Candidatus Dojkabacteria bacterium]|nr:hypothetical protein [Candidatus Dojkabacteria bacterium]MDQ7020624.1 hypothetical protein [Candidatus Dojkabacteria bacterium]
MKQEQMQKLISDLREDSLAENIVINGNDKSLVNQYKLHDNIPNKWFDWVNRVDAQVMIIGQDWGPYSVLKKMIEDPTYTNDEERYWGTFSSRTEKFIMKAIQSTYEEEVGEFNRDVFDKFIFTMAVLFTRKGNHFRGVDNFHEKRSFEISYPYVSRQIDIVKPKVIMPLGRMGVEILDKKFELGLFIDKTLTQIVEENLDKEPIRVGDYSIIPNFHPASHTDPKKQIRQWRKIWEIA